jgi:hypothetical protein
MANTVLVEEVIPQEMRQKDDSVLWTGTDGEEVTIAYCKELSMHMLVRLKNLMENLKQGSLFPSFDASVSMAVSGRSWELNQVTSHTQVTCIIVELYLFSNFVKWHREIWRFDPEQVQPFDNM